MAASPSALTMSVEEYLNTTFRPDVDYVDGVIEERNVGEWDHGALTLAIARLLQDRQQEWGVRVAPEVRVQVLPTNFRIPDVCVVDARYPREQIVRRPPLLCVEVVSPRDRLARLVQRAKEFHAMGVGDVWIFDPQTGKVWVSTPGALAEHAGGELTVLGTAIAFDPQAAFALAEELG
jgi:Uma2 family endonuclease